MAYWSGGVFHIRKFPGRDLYYDIYDKEINGAPMNIVVLTVRGYDCCRKKVFWHPVILGGIPTAIQYAPEDKRLSITIKKYLGDQKNRDRIYTMVTDIRQRMKNQPRREVQYHRL